MIIYLASYNQNKLREFKETISDSSIEIKISDKYIELKETGKTFLENSTIKALTISKFVNEFVVADDSGLVVSALNGAPGLYSARYAGENASNQDKINKLLDEMKDVSKADRKAYFVCSLVLVKNSQIIFNTEEKCYGEIALESKGSYGFGFDPVFYIPEFNKTMAELEPEIKNQISHRGKAIKKLNEFLMKQNQSFLREM